MVNVEMGTDKGYDTGYPVLEKWPRLSKGIKRQEKNLEIPSVSVSFLSSAPLFSTFLSLFLDFLFYLTSLCEPRDTLPGHWRQASVKHLLFTVQKTVSRTQGTKCSCRLPTPSCFWCVCLQSQAPKVALSMWKG